MLSLSSAYIDPQSPPTIFELGLASAYSSSLQPAFDFTFDFFSDNSRILRRATNLKDECFLALMFLVERSYLATCESSFEENMYGLRRVNAATNGLISPSQKLSSILELVTFPYVMKKIAAQSLHLDPSNPLSSLARFVLALYELSVLFFQAAYVIGRVKFYSPLLFLQNITLVRLNADDVRRQEALAAAALGAGWNGGVLDKARYLFKRASGALQRSLMLAAMIFTLARMYGSPENRARREAMKQGSNAILIPPPPQPLPLTPQGVLLVKDPNLCPLCGQIRKLPATSSSGYAFCYACISQYVTEHGTCPVTGIPCSLAQVRRIYFTG